MSSDQARSGRNAARTSLLKMSGCSHAGVRAFIDYAVPRLKRYVERLSRDAKGSADHIRSQHGRLSAG